MKNLFKEEIEIIHSFEKDLKKQDEFLDKILSNELREYIDKNKREEIVNRYKETLANYHQRKLELIMKYIDWDEKSGKIIINKNYEF